MPEQDDGRVAESRIGSDRLTLAARFNEKHGCELLEQTLKIQEEAGEVAEAALSADGSLLFKDGHRFDLGDELAQLIVTAYYLAELHGVVDIDDRIDDELQANLYRDGQTVDTDTHLFGGAE